MDAAALLPAAAYVPAFFWDFRTGAVPPGALFARASSATYFDASGVLRTAGSNVPRFDRDPLTGAPLGYLAEMQSTNSVVASRALTDASWAATGLTVVDNAVVSPDGTQNAGTLLEDSANTIKQISATFSTVANEVRGFSTFAKEVAGGLWVQLVWAGGQGYFNFQPSTGTLGSSGGLIPPTKIFTQQLANGWWRIGAQFSYTGSASTSIRVGIVNTGTAAASANYLGTGTAKIAVWGIQHDTAGVGVTSYIPTSGAAATRAQDVLTMPLTSLPGWNPSQGGVFTATYRLNTLYPVTPGYNQSPVYVQAIGGYLNSLHMLANYGGAGQYGGWMYNAAPSVGYGGASSAPFVRRRQAFGWQANRVVSAVDGGGLLLNTTTLAIPTSLATAYFGAYGTGGHGLGGTLESVAYYAGARSDAFVQQVSR